MLQPQETLRLEAEAGVNQGGHQEAGGNSGSKLILDSSGDAVCWPATDLAGVGRLTIHYSNGEVAGDTLTATADGAVLGTLTVQSTGGWSAPLFIDGEINFAPQTGAATLCVTGTGQNWIAGIDYVIIEGTGICTPDCTSKVCGPDGCGGTCGSCPGGQTCDITGQCQIDPGPPAQPLRLEVETAVLSGVTLEGGADSSQKAVNFHEGDTICWPNTDLRNVTSATVRYGNAEPPGDTLELTSDGTTVATFLVGSTGGWSTPQLADVSAAVTAPSSSSATLCLTGRGANWLATVDYIDIERQLCTPDCAGKACGGDGCGGSCGTCPNPTDTCTAAGQCNACIPTCTGRSCGDDGCGGSCGTCSGTDTCGASGQCEACVPQCTGRTCGDDGCGGSCGTCSGDETCSPAGTCQVPGRAQYVPAGYRFIWGDDFGGIVGQGQSRSAVDQTSWTFQNLHVNNEAQNYSNKECNDPDHSNDWNYCVEDGRLRIQARPEGLDCSDNGQGSPINPDCADHFSWPAQDMRAKGYSSGRLITKNKVNHRYGYIEFRVRLPHANRPAPQSGSWTAIWMLGQNIDEGPVDVSRPACTADTDCNTLDREVCDKGVCAVKWPWTGEDDIMEWKSRGNQSEMAHNLIWIGADGNYEACNPWPEGGSFNCGDCIGGTCDIVQPGANGRYYWSEYPFDHTQWHTYGLRWTSQERRYYVDGVEKSAATIGISETEFQKDMFLIMNYALGGDLGGQIEISDWANAFMDIDYIEWYQSPVCIPNCTNKTCGSDGCDGVCGTCTGGQICNGISQCTATLEAEDGLYDSDDITLETIGGEQRLRMDSSGDNVCFSGVNMDGVTGVRADYANGEPGGDQLIIRYDGAVLGPIDVIATGSWSVDGNTAVNFPAQSGTGTLCIEAVTSNAGWIAALNRITLL